MPLWTTRSAGSAAPQTNRFSLQSGQTQLLGPSDGVYQVNPGHYGCVQYFDPIL